MPTQDSITKKTALTSVTKMIPVTLVEEDWRRLRTSAAENGLSVSTEVGVILQTVIVAKANGQSV